MNTESLCRSADPLRSVPVALTIALSLLIALPVHSQDPKLVRAAAPRAESGLLTERDYRALEQQLTTRRTHDYVYRILGEKGRAEDVRGLLLLRSPQDLQPVGQNFYHDGRGNLVYFGQFPRKQAQQVSYSLTLLKDGSSQLAMDLDGDRVVDAVVSRGLDRFGFLAPEDLQEMGDCYERARLSGDDPLRAALDCLPGAPSRGGGRAWNDFLNRFSEPECGAAGSGPRGPGTDWLIDPGEESYDEEARESRDWAVRSEEAHRQMAEEAREADDRQLAEANDRVADDFADIAEASQRYLDSPPSSEEREQAQADATEAYDRLGESMNYLRAILEARERDRRERESGRAGSSGDPVPGEIPNASDPRCQPKPNWAWMYSEQCRLDPIDCLRRLNDPVYAATDGQCRTQTGEDDEPVVRCRGNDTMRDCIAAGGSPEECAEQTIDTCSAEGPGGRRPEGCEGFTPADRPSPVRGPRSDIKFLQISQLGGVIAAICRDAGGTGLCGDSAPMR